MSDKALLVGLLSMAAMFPMQHFDRKMPKEKPHKNQTKQFKKTKAKRKLSQTSRRRNRG